jgi:hypothetical protein
VPTGFRKGPINFSRVKYYSKQAELQFFGVDGFEVAEEKKEESIGGLQIARLDGVENWSSESSFITKM